MGEGPLTERRRRPSWKLKPPHDALTQGIVVSGFSKLPSAQALFLFDAGEADGSAAGWLRTLAQVAPISDASGREARAAAIAFTCTGLQKLGLGDEMLATFSAPFREGMYQDDRLRRLGDRIDRKWQGTVIEGGPRWSGNIPIRELKASVPDGFRGRPKDPEEPRVTTPTTVHALLLLYDKDVASVQKWADDVTGSLAPHSIRIAHRLLLDLQLDENDIGREHFGFADGLSQPIPFGEDKGDGTRDDCVILSDGTPATRDRWHVSRSGRSSSATSTATMRTRPGRLCRKTSTAREKPPD